MTPITRKENYLNEIVGWGETAPEKSLTPEEFFFAAILGEAVQTPEPLSRYQKYLAKIAGRNISVPKPLTRLELFLAKACGMDIETPTPITREEIFWSNYSAIVDFEVEGVPPFTYKAIEGTIENYRIYGNTVGRESVGDRTGNLFDGELVDGYQIGQNGLPSTYAGRCCITSPIAIEAENLIISYTAINYLNTRCMYSVLVNGELIRRVTNVATGQAIDTSGGDELYVGFYHRLGDALTSTDVSNIMLNVGSTPLPYEPYGYRVPVTINDVTTNLYLSEPLKMVSDEAEYIDYGLQKQHFSDGTETDVTLPALPVAAGTNVLSVGTAVQPSKVYVKYKGERQ